MEWNKSLITLLLSLILVISTLVVILFTDYTINLTHYIGFGSLVLLCVLYVKNKRIYSYTFIIVLIAGLFGFLDFFFATVNISLNIFKINPIFLILLILFFVFSNYD